MKSRFSRLFFWFTQITSIIGLAGIIEDLRTWQAGVRWIIAQAYALQPWVASVITGFGAGVHSITDAWRYVMHPVIEVLFLWVPFDMPYLIKELVLVALFAIAGWFRAEKLWGSNEIGPPASTRRAADPAMAYLRYLDRQSRLERWTRITVIALSCGALVLIAVDHVATSVQ